MDADLAKRCRARMAQNLKEPRSKTPFQLYSEEYKRTHPMRNYPISESCYPPPDTRPLEKLVADLIAENEALRTRLLALEGQCVRLIEAWEKTMQPYHQWALKLAQERLERVQKTQKPPSRNNQADDTPPIWER